jgi:hypothetical protein
MVELSPGDTDWSPVLMGKEALRLGFHSPQFTHANFTKHIGKINPGKYTVSTTDMTRVHCFWGFHFRVSKA